MCLQAVLEREDLAQSYMLADAECEEVGKPHKQRFQSKL